MRMHELMAVSNVVRALVHAASRSFARSSSERSVTCFKLCLQYQTRVLAPVTAVDNVSFPLKTKKVTDLELVTREF